MKPIITDISEMTDSREMYESRTSKAGTAFVYTLLGLLAAAIVWMCIGKIDVCVNADGIVKPSDSISTVINVREGFVEEVFYKSSESVSKGDILYAVEHSDLLARRDYYSEQIVLTEEETEALKAYINAVEENEDFLEFPSESGIALRYKTQYGAFRMNLESLRKEYETSEKSIASETEHIKNQLSKTGEEIKGYEWLYSKVTGEETDEAFDDIFFVLQYENYLAKREELLSSAVSAKKLYEINCLLEGEAVSSYETEESKKAYDNALLAYQNQKNAFILDLEVKKRTLDDEKTNLDKSLSDLEIKKEKLQHSDNSQYGFLAVEKTVKDELSSVMQLLESKEKTLSELKNGINETDEAIKQCNVAAPISGIVHEVYAPIEGDFLPAGREILVILPENEEEYKAVVFLNNADRGNVEAGMNVKINVSSFPSSEHGYITGKLTEVARDITVDQATGRAYYRADAEINIDTAVDKKGNRLPLESGMACEVKIITGEKTVMRWVLEILSLLTKEK